MMEGTIKTPFGPAKKQTLLIAGAGVVIMGMLYMRSKKASDNAAAIAASGESVGINPATGYVYGSAEDAAALANQADYMKPGGGGSGGGGSSYAGSSPGTFVSNAQWTQYAQNYLTDNDVVTDPGKLGDALGKFISGQPVTNDQRSLIQQAIAIAGLPPVAGPSGYPPSINTSPAPPTPDADTGTQKYFPPIVDNGRYAAVLVGTETWTNSLPYIARAYGWPDARMIWSDSSNAALRKLRGEDYHTAQLKAGDTVYAWFNPNKSEAENIWRSIVHPK